MGYTDGSSTRIQQESDYTEALSSVGSVNDDGWQVSNHPCQVTGEKADR